MSQVKQLGQYKDVEVIVSKKEVTQEEIDQQINSLVANRPQFIEKEGEVAQGDLTTIDFVGLKDGVAFEGGTAQGYQLEIGSGQFIPGFEEQMVGMTKGETRELNLTFPENYGMPDLAGADVIFKVTVHKIEAKKESELNDEFVKSLNDPNMSTVADLEEQMKAHLQTQYNQEYQMEVENVLFAKIIESSEVEVDDNDIEAAMQQHIQHISMELAQQGMPLEQYLQMVGMTMETLRQQLEPAAKNQAIFEAIIDEVVKVENIATTDEEIDQQVQAIAEHNQITKEEVLEKINIEDLKRDFNRMKSSQFIIEHAIINS